MAAGALALVIMVALAAWIFNAVRDSFRWRATSQYLGRVGMSLRDYSKFHGHLPYPVVTQRINEQLAETKLPGETDRPLYSWRVEIIVYLEAWHGVWDRSQTWDHPANRQLAELSSFYAYSATRAKGHPQSFLDSNILAITGPGTAFGDGKEQPMALKDVPPSTIIAVETCSSGIPWPAPGDFDVRTMPRTICARDGRGISSWSADNKFHVLFADGAVWSLSEKVPFQTLSMFFTVSSASRHNREQLIGPYTLHRGL